MRVLIDPVRRRRKNTTALLRRKYEADRASSQITPQAQQGVEECQDQCDSEYDDPMEQLECYKSECWS